MMIRSHCNDCHDTVFDRDRSQSAFIPGISYDWDMHFSRDTLEPKDNIDIMKAALDFIAQLKERKAV